MQSLHGSAISRLDVSRLLDICIRTIPITIKTCPLCVLKPRKDDYNPEALLDYIADHIHNFSLLSLPWADTPPETVIRVEKAAFCKVRNWLDEKAMDDDDSEDEICDPTPNVLLLDYFAESAGASSCAHRESQASRSTLTLDSRSGVDSEIGSDVEEPPNESSSEREVAAELPTDSLGLNTLVTRDNAVVE